ncbi:hypothetical protein EGR_09528 [Echinococcus granulosus]|uniref:Uncharacterized protein n=1 Tax=Echinococcus granulosus TaxID=6210 RepID=W6U3C9_ECHGR|nr:hypothetical protein EGR_09528 [Echinococcus granulosus]EUB55633.1 hypothetical protein EGR_09528 [Echinococcus granulosus]
MMCDGFAFPCTSSKCRHFRVDEESTTKSSSNIVDKATHGLDAELSYAPDLSAKTHSLLMPPVSDNSFSIFSIYFTAQLHKSSGTQPEQKCNESMHAEEDPILPSTYSFVSLLTLSLISCSFGQANMETERPDSCGDNKQFEANGAVCVVKCRLLTSIGRLPTFCYSIRSVSNDYDDLSILDSTHSKRKEQRSPKTAIETLPINFFCFYSLTQNVFFTDTSRAWEFGTTITFLLNILKPFNRVYFHLFTINANAKKRPVGDQFFINKYICSNLNWLDWFSVTKQCPLLAFQKSYPTFLSPLIASNRLLSSSYLYALYITYLYLFNICVNAMITKLDAAIRLQNQVVHSSFQQYAGVNTKTNQFDTFGLTDDLAQALMRNMKDQNNFGMNFMYDNTNAAELHEIVRCKQICGIVNNKADVECSCSKDKWCILWFLQRKWNQLKFVETKEWLVRKKKKYPSTGVNQIEA